MNSNCSSEMDWLNNIREGLKSGYDSFDNTIGGVLPGGAQLDLGAFGGAISLHRANP